MVVIVTPPRRFGVPETLDFRGDLHCIRNLAIGLDIDLCVQEAIGFWACQSDYLHTSLHTVVKPRYLFSITTWLPQKKNTNCYLDFRLSYRYWIMYFDVLAPLP